MEQQPISNNFRILLLILTIPQSIAVGISFQLVFLFEVVWPVFDDKYGDMPLPPITRFLIEVFQLFEPAIEIRNQVSVFLGVTFLALAIISIWSKKETFSKCVIDWAVPSVAIWSGLFMWGAVIAVGLVAPFTFKPHLMVPQQYPPPSPPPVPRVPLEPLQVIASLSLLTWIIFLAISVTLFLRKKTRSTNQ